MSNLLIKIVYHINCYDMQPILSLYCLWLVFLLVSPTILCPVYAQYGRCCVFKLLSYCFFCFQLACLQVAAFIHYQLCVILLGVATVALKIGLLFTIELKFAMLLSYNAITYSCYWNDLLIFCSRACTCRAGGHETGCQFEAIGIQLCLEECSN